MAVVVFSHAEEEEEEEQSVVVGAYAGGGRDERTMPCLENVTSHLPHPTIPDSSQPHPGSVGDSTYFESLVKYSTHVASYWCNFAKPKA